MEVVPIRSQREARRLHAEQKGGPLEGTRQQKSIKDFLAKIKNKKNYPEVHQKLMGNHREGEEPGGTKNEGQN